MLDIEMVDRAVVAWVLKKYFAVIIVVLQSF
jgi:hypothetical protein